MRYLSGIHEFIQAMGWMNYLFNLLLTMSVRATWQPRVPAPRSKHLVDAMRGKSSDGNNLHLINFRFRSAADSANLPKELICQIKYFENNNNTNNNNNNNSCDNLDPLSSAFIFQTRPFIV
jgi:hypothetical protein